MSARRISEILLVAMASAVAVWGARATWLEGIVYAWPRGFAGDFFAVMFDPAWWDGTGIQYGPVVVIERWLTEAAPHLLTIYFYAIANLLLAAGAFIACARAARAPTVAVVIAAGAWLGFSRLSDALAVAANPEFLELGFLSAAWLAASRQRARLQGALHGVAAVTKLVPVVFLLVLVLGRRWRALAAAAVIAGSLIWLVGHGQGLSPVGAVVGTLVPVGNVEPNTRYPDPTSYLIPELSRQSLGVNSALARGLGLDGSASAEAGYIGLISVLIVSWAVAVATAASALLHRSRSEIGEDAVHLTYSVFFALLPIVTLRAHPHTFLFLLPVWSGVAAVLIRRWRLTDLPFVFLFGACYVLTGFPLLARLVDRVLLSGLEANWAGFEPIWANLALLAILCVFGVHVAHRNGRLRVN